MKKVFKITAAVLAAVMVCTWGYSFFVCPLPDFTITTDGFAEQKIIGGRFMIQTPLKAQTFYWHNEKKFPQLRYLSASERLKIKERLDYFIENASEDDVKNTPVDSQKLLIAIGDREYYSILQLGARAPVSRTFSFEPDSISVPNGYNKDYTYDGAVELWVEVSRSAPFFSTERVTLLTNTWLWLYGDRCVGVVGGRTYNNPPRDKIVQPNKFERLIENLVVWYLQNFD